MVSFPFLFPFGSACFSSDNYTAADAKPQALFCLRKEEEQGKIKNSRKNQRITHKKRQKQLRVEKEKLTKEQVRLKKAQTQLKKEQKEITKEREKQNNL